MLRTVCCFFFQAEDGIRDIGVTGVQTCALPISEINPLTGEKIYIAKTFEEKSMQRALLQFSKPENYNLVKKALIKAGREDLIGFGKDCLIPPRQIKSKNTNFKKKTNTKSTSLEKETFNTNKRSKNNFKNKSSNKKTRRTGR